MCIRDRTYTDLCFMLAVEFYDAQIITSSIHSTIRIISPCAISLERLKDKLKNCYDVIVTNPYSDEICAIIKAM